MREAKEITKHFKNNFNRDIKIFAAWVGGSSTKSLSKEYNLCLDRIRAAIHRGSRAAMYANEMCYDDLPFCLNINDYRKTPEIFKTVANNALKLNIPGA